MTRAACNLVLTVAKICLSYRSIKSLKRSGKNENYDKSNNNSSHIDKENDHTNKENSEDDLEILQLWSLIAFLAIYEQSGAEHVISFFPLYYYFKMIIIVITAIPSTKFPDFWCELMLVPMMQKCHELMDLDWRSFLEEEVVLLPWRVLDLTILPGVFCDDLILEEVKRKRLMQIEKAIEDGRYVNVGSDENDEMEEIEDIDINEEKDENDSGDIADCGDDDIDIDDDIHEEQDSTAMTVIDLNTNDEQNETTLKASSKDGPTRTHSPSKSKPPSKSPSPSKSSSKSTSTRKKRQPLNRKTTTTASTTKTRRQTSLTSPVARSRVAASSLHLRKFQRDHKASSGLIRETKAMALRNKKKSPSPSPSKQRTAGTSGGKGRTKSTGRTTRNRTKAPPLSAFQRARVTPTMEETSKTTTDPTSEQEGETVDKDTINTLIDESDEGDDRRATLNHRLRNFITGDTNIRIRDYLFDLDLPATPSRDSTMPLGMSKTFEFDNDHDEPDERESGEDKQRRKKVGGSSSVSKRDHDTKSDVRRRAARQTNQKKDSTSAGKSNVTVRRSQRIAGKK